MTKERASIAALLTSAKVLFILLSLLLIQEISIIRSATENAAMRAGTGNTGFKFLIYLPFKNKRTIDEPARQMSSAIMKGTGLSVCTSVMISSTDIAS